MKKKSTVLLAALSMTVGSMFGQLAEGAGGTLTSLLPDGVTANIATETKAMKTKDLVVAGDDIKGYQAFFPASDAANGEELWVTDGTPGGTKMVKDIYPGTTGSSISFITRFNDKVVFSATDGTNGTELWTSDGTPDGTYMVKNIYEGATGSDPRAFTQLNETQFVFGAKDGAGSPWRLYISDGTPDGTLLLYNCDTKLDYGSYGINWTTVWRRVGRKVFFKAAVIDGESNGNELWVTDGTADGTHCVKDINPGATSSSTNYLTNFYNEKLFFCATTATNGVEPWTSDGTDAGTYMVIDSNPGTASGFSSSAYHYPYNGKIYYRGYSASLGIELACTNLDEEDYTVLDVNTVSPTASNNSTPDIGMEFDGVYMFAAGGGAGIGGDVFYTDGTSVSAPYGIAGTANHWARNFTVVSGSLYWWNSGGAVAATQNQLFKLDGKDKTPACISAFTASTSINVHSLRNLNGNLLFNTANTDKGLYLYNYRKEGYSPAADTHEYDHQKDMEYRTRAEKAAALKRLDKKAGDYGTICFPGQVTSATNAELYQVEGYTHKNDVPTMLYLTKVELSETVPGTPYLYMAVADGDVEFTHNFGVCVAGNNKGLVGAFQKTLIAQNPDNYVLGTDNKLHYVDSEYYCKTNFAYLSLSDDIKLDAAPAPAPGLRSLSFDDNGATGISAETATDLVDVYTTLGVQVRSRVERAVATQGLPQGIYIVDGKKHKHE